MLSSKHAAMGPLEHIHMKTLFSTQMIDRKLVTKPLSAKVRNVYHACRNRSLLGVLPQERNSSCEETTNDESSRPEPAISSHPFSS